MSKNIGRNDPCPCGSGLKYKKCCLGKEDNPKYSEEDNFAALYKEVRKKSRIKECIHPDKTHCSERIIGAHSIQNNKILSKISDNGYVYMPCPKPEIQPDLQYKYGRKEATTFTGFCGFHDKTTFQPIEDSDFIGTAEQVFLHIYRVFALEYHKKKEANRMTQNLFAEKPSIVNRKGVIKNGKTGYQVAVSDYEDDKEIFDHAILNKEYNVLTYFVWTFDGFSNFAATGGETPTNDFNGNAIQDLKDFSIPARHIYISVFPENDKTYAIIAWLKRDDSLFETIKQKLLTLDEEEKKNYINNTIVFSCENIVMKPSSWEAWPDGIKDRFEEAYEVSMFSSMLIGDMVHRLEKPPFDLFSL